MKTKALKATMIVGLALLLTGCGASATKSGSSSSSLLASKSNEKLRTSDLTPESSASLIATYAGNKYGKDWASAVKQAPKRGFQVNLYPTSRYRLSNNGQGVAYDVNVKGESKGLVYTLNGDTINIYSQVKLGGRGHRLGTVSRAQMVKYVNHYGQAKLVDDLAAKTQVVDKRNGSNNNSSATNQSTSHKYGRKGQVDVPADMQGTWYCADDDTDSTLTFGPHSISSDGDTDQIYKQDSNFLANYQGDTQIADATKNWSSGAFVDVHGLHYLNVRETAGDGDFFAVHTENIDGHAVKVLVAAGGAKVWTSNVYYQNKDQAQNYVNHKFDDLYYMDDDN